MQHAVILSGAGEDKQQTHNTLSQLCLVRCVSDPPLSLAPAKPRQYYLIKCYEIGGACLRGPLQRYFLFRFGIFFRTTLVNIIL